MPAYLRLPIMALFALLLHLNRGAGQSLNQPASNAWIITRLAEKFHIQPKPLDDTLSANFFSRFLDKLDAGRFFFNQSDTAQLAPYRFHLDDQLKQRKTDFLRLAKRLYTERLRQTDSLIDTFGKNHFDFSNGEKRSLAEDTSFPAGISSMRSKLYKKVKLEVLNGLLMWNDQFLTADQTPMPGAFDSVQSALEKQVLSVYRRDIKRIFQSPGGVDQFISDAYCKALASCYDPHTMFFPLTEKENFESELGSRRFRFGFSIAERPAGGTEIKGLEPGSPAFQCGLLHTGDQFLTLRWQGQKAIDVSNADVGELGLMLSQSNHDQLTITVKKPDGSQRTVTLTKSRADSDEEDRVKSFLLKGNQTIGYISLPAFYSSWNNENEGDHGCANDVAREILKLKKDSISGLILDLRYNGGGSMQEAVELTGIFIDAGPVAQIKTRAYDKVITLKDVHRGAAYTGPLIILVNGYSASASELVAGSLQDYHRALIVGSSTFGKATAQVILPLDTTININTYDGNDQADDYLKITTTQLFRITGTTAQFKGVTPDVVLPEVPEAFPHREANEWFALPASNIAPNPYYKPYAALPVTALQTVAAKDMDHMSFFVSLKNYIHSYHPEVSPPETSLDWKPALEKERAKLKLSSDTASFTAGYSVQSNTYDQRNADSYASPADISAVFIPYLKHDPYIKVCYDLIGHMTK